METEQRVTKSPSTPCGRLIIRDGHEINEIRVESKSETTRLVQKSDHELPEKEKICDKDGARNKEQEVGRDSSRARNLLSSAKIMWSNWMKDCETEVLKLENKFTMSLHAKDEELRNLEVTLHRVRQEHLDIRDADQKEVQRLKAYIEQKENDAEFHADHLKAKCQKLGSQLALIEQKAAQESLTSGSYSDDHANPSMLEVACKTVDKAIDDLARVLYNTSILNGIPRETVKFEYLIRQISPAQPADFSRAIQVRYVWSYWLCYQMFRGFENVFFDFDQRNRTSPLDSKKHALECFQSFQQKTSASSLELLNGCGNFRSFFSWKYKCVLPAWLVDSGIVVNEYGRFVEEKEIFDRVMNVARAVWLLHELAFSFDPPASIRRMARGEPYDKQFHDSVVHVEDGEGPSAVVALMMRPAFCIRKSIVRSRVLLSTKLPK